MLLIIAVAPPALANNATHHQVTFVNNGTVPVYVNILGGQIGKFPDGSTCSACSLNGNGIGCPTTNCPNVYNGSGKQACTQGDPLVENGGFRVDGNGGTRIVYFPKGWQGNFWVRTNCRDDGLGNLSCDTANCVNNNPADPNPKLRCGGVGSQTPATKAEFAFDANNYDTYDVSLVDGFNAPVRIRPVANFQHGCQTNASYDCATTGGTADLNSKVKAEKPLLNVTNSSGSIVAVLSACQYSVRYLGGENKSYCCLPPFEHRWQCNQSCGAANCSSPPDPARPGCTWCDPGTWPASINSAAFFKRYYPLDYSYADDDDASTFCCRSCAPPWNETQNTLSDYEVAIYGPEATAPLPGGTLEFVVPLDTGWNLFSTPVSLSPGKNTLGGIFSEEDRIDAVLGWNGRNWFSPGASYVLSPLDAIYVRFNGESEAHLSPYEGVTAPPARVLPAGLSLVGPSPPYDRGDNGGFTGMPVSQAFASVETVPGGGDGYVMVISPGLNQPGWGYARGGTPRDLLPFRGYWVIMENPGTLFGFSTTPLSPD